MTKPVDVAVLPVGVVLGEYRQFSLSLHLVFADPVMHKVHSALTADERVAAAAALFGEHNKLSQSIAWRTLCGERFPYSVLTYGDVWCAEWRYTNEWDGLSMHSKYQRNGFMEPLRRFKWCRRCRRKAHLPGVMGEVSMHDARRTCPVLERLPRVQLGGARG